jgi:hypothetical protein
MLHVVCLTKYDGGALLTRLAQDYCGQVLLDRVGVGPASCLSRLLTHVLKMFVEGLTLLDLAMG